MKIKVLFIALLVSAFSWGQVTIASDGLNNSSSLFTVTGGTYYTGNSAGSGVDVPFTSPFASEGTYSYGVTNGTATLTTPTSINTTGYTSIYTTFRLASFSIGSTGNGADGTDIVTVEVSPNAGTTYYSTVRVLGNSNATWSYAAGTGNASTPYDGNVTPVNFTPAAGGARTTDGYSTVTITGLPATTTLKIRITLFNNAASERWVIDDFKVEGTSSTPCTTPTTQASSLTSNNVSTTGADLSWSDGGSTSGSLVSLRLKSNALTAPSSGTDYTPTLNFSTAAGPNLIDANNVVVAKNATETVTSITGLTAGTQYSATPYAYNGSGTNVCFNTTNPESFDFYTLALEPTASPASLSCGVSSLTSIGLTYPAASTLTNASGYVLIYRIGAAPTGMPADGTLYAPGDIIGDATFYSYIAPASVGTTVTGLNGGATYYFALIPYGSVLSIVETLNYRITSPRINNCSTLPAPEINVKGVIASNPSILDGDITPNSLDNTLYGTVVVASSQSKNFRIENTGNANLTVSSISMVGGNTGDFAATTTALGAIPFPLTIAGGAFYDFTVTFTPTAAGTRNTTLTIVNNDATPAESSYDFVIQGTGTVTPIVEINVKGNSQSIPDNSIYPQGTNWTAFPVTLQGNTSSRVFTIENLGTTVLSLTGASPYIQISGTHASSFSVVPTYPSNGIAGGGTTTFQINFSPTSGGQKNATITIGSNDADEAVYNFNISGTCQGPNNIYTYGNGYDVVKGSVTTSTTNLTNFGLIPVTTGVKQNTFVITNLSSSSRYLTDVTITGADAAMFTAIAQPNNGAVTAGKSTSFTINFTPTSAGVKNATVTFNTYTNSTRTTLDATDPVYTFAISGEGIVYTPCTNNAVQTIAIQDFEAVPAAPLWPVVSTITDGSVNITGGTFNNGSGAANAFIGARSFQFKGTNVGTTRSAVLTMNSVDVSQYNNIVFSMRVGAFRTTGTTQGLDINDLIQVETSIDGGVNWSVESVLRGYINSRWNFAATGAFTAYYTGNNSGITLDTRQGNAELTGAAGITNYYIKNLPQSTALLIRITLNVDRDDELWALDNIKLEGQLPQTSTWNGASWVGGFPTSSTKAVFDTGTSYTTTAAANHGSVQACELQIKSTATVNIDPNYYFEIQSNITNDGTLNVADMGSLVQINDAATNLSPISYKRTAYGIRGFDYVYWSSPVAGQLLSSMYATTGLKYAWNPLATNINSASGSSGNWVTPPSAMAAGSGYIVRGSPYYTTPAADITSTFSGEVNNGVIPVSITRGANTALTTIGGGNGISFSNYDDNWNLVGNPYPSAVNAKAFLSYNTNLQGFIYLWKHINAPTAIANPFYNSFLYNYNASNDYLAYNALGAQTQNGFGGYIAAGQGFFVLMNDGPGSPDPTASQTVNFRNYMRNKTYSNAQFYKTANLSTSSSSGEEGEEKHRIWLDLVDSNNESVRTLVGYATEATNGLDRMYDAYKNTANATSIYSLAENKTLIIQGRSLPFNDNDQVPVGVTIKTAGTYKIAIAAVDGLFSETAQNIYLEDKQLGVIYNLRENPYTFDAPVGIFNDRFLLRYNTTTLSNPDFGSADNNVIISTNHGQMNIKSYVEALQDVTVYDILGRQLFEAKSIGNKDFTASDISMSQQALIVKIKLESGIIVTRKIVL